MAPIVRLGADGERVVARYGTPLKSGRGRGRLCELNKIDVLKMTRERLRVGERIEPEPAARYGDDLEPLWRPAPRDNVARLECPSILRHFVPLGFC